MGRMGGLKYNKIHPQNGGGCVPLALNENEETSLSSYPLVQAAVEDEGFRLPII